MVSTMDSSMTLKFHRVPLGMQRTKHISRHFQKYHLMIQTIHARPQDFCRLFCSSCIARTLYRKALIAPWCTMKPSTSRAFSAHLSQAASGWGDLQDYRIRLHTGPMHFSFPVALRMHTQRLACRRDSMARIPITPDSKKGCQKRCARQSFSREPRCIPRL